MKIVFLLNNMDFGGAERTVLALSNYLRSRHEVTILCMQGPCAYDVPDNVRVVNLNICNQFNNVIGRVKNALLRTIAIRNAVSRLKPDVVFCIMGINAKYLTSAIRRNYSLIVSERSNPKYYDEKTRRKLRNIYSKCDGIVFQTDRVCSLYEDIESSKKIVIPNAISNPLVYELNWNGRNAKRVVAVGRLVFEKDYPTLIEAFNIFIKNHEGYILEIYGSGPDENKIKELVENLGLKGMIRLEGSRNDALTCAAKAACYVLSSVCEGMPNTLLEAMGIGMPCVATDCEYGPAELIENGENGLLVECGSPEKLAEAMAKMVDDTEFAERCAENARRIRYTHSLVNVGKAYEDFFLFKQLI